MKPQALAKIKRRDEDRERLGDHHTWTEAERDCHALLEHVGALERGINVLVEEQHRDVNELLDRNQVLQNKITALTAVLDQYKANIAHALKELEEDV